MQHNQIIKKPTSGQYPSWASSYINRIPEGEVLAYLETGLELVIDYIENLTDEQLLYSYAEGKWTIKEVLIHLMDVERVFAYRGLTSARHDTTPLPGFDHSSYVLHSGVNQRNKESLIAEYRTIRQSTIQLFSNMTEEALDFIGQSNGLPSTAKAMVYMIAGHERHHLQLFEERYQQ